MHTPAHEKRPWPETAIKMDRAQPSGVVLFTNSLTELMESIIETQNYSYFDEKKLPLVLFPRGTNMLGFSKRFTSIIAAQYVTEYQHDEWLRGLTYSGIYPGGETIAESYGYHPEFSYFCLLITTRKTLDDNTIPFEMDMNSARRLISRELSFEDAPVLSFVDKKPEEYPPDINGIFFRFYTSYLFYLFITNYLLTLRSAIHSHPVLSRRTDQCKPILARQLHCLTSRNCLARKDRYPGSNRFHDHIHRYPAA